MAGDVHLGVALVDDGGAPPGEPVDDAVDRGLVAGDQGGGQDDGVALDDADLVVAVGHPGEGGHGFALGAGADQDDLVVGKVVEDLDVDDEAAWGP